MGEIRLPEQNVVLLTGRLTRDAELKYTALGAAMCRFSIAVNRRFKDPKSGEWKDDTSYVDISTWRETAERCGKADRLGIPPGDPKGRRAKRVKRVGVGARKSEQPHAP